MPWSSVATCRPTLSAEHTAVCAVFYFYPSPADSQWTQLCDFQNRNRNRKPVLALPKNEKPVLQNDPGFGNPSLHVVCLFNPALFVPFVPSSHVHVIHRAIWSRSHIIQSMPFAPFHNLFHNYQKLLWCRYISWVVGLFSVLTLLLPLNLYNYMSVVLPYVVNCVALQFCMLAFSETQGAGSFLSTERSFMRPLGPIIFLTFASINVSISNNKLMRLLHYITLHYIF